MGKYTLKVSENGTDYDEQVEVDTEKETEIFHVPKISPEKDSGDIIYDFKKVIYVLTCIIQTFAIFILREVERISQS